MPQPQTQDEPPAGTWPEILARWFVRLRGPRQLLVGGAATVIVAGGVMFWHGDFGSGPEPPEPTSQGCVIINSPNARC